MIRATLIVLTAALALPVAVNANASPTPAVAKAETKTAEGTVKTVDAKAMSFVLTTGLGHEAKDITVKVTNDTKYTLDGKASTMAAALVAGNKVKVKHADGTASQVDATSAKKP